MKGKIEYISITGQKTGKEILFSLYLPGDYFNTPEKKFPVLYFLHGLNEDYTSHIQTVALYMERVVESGLLDPMILVAPDGYMDTMWVDSADGEKPAWTHLMEELIPHVEKVYPVMADRDHRIMAGFSMGGYGAVRCALRHPELFSLCISLDGAIHILNTFKAIRPDIYKHNFNGDADYFNAWCVYYLSRQNIEKIRGNVRFFLLAGILESFNDRFFKHMTDLGLLDDNSYYNRTGCKHDVSQMLDKEGLRLCEWIRKHTK